MNFFYFDQTNQKRGPVSEQQLKELAAQGIIGPHTPMETDDGHKGIAGQIPGLFIASPSSFAQTVQKGLSAFRAARVPLNAEQRKERITSATMVCMVLCGVCVASQLFSSLLVAVESGGGSTRELEFSGVAYAYSFLPIFLPISSILSLISYSLCYYFYVLWLWEEIPREVARTTPKRAAVYSFIPLFAYYWMFVAILGLYKDMNKTTEHNGLGSRFDTTLIVAACIGWLFLGIIPMLSGVVLSEADSRLRLSMFTLVLYGIVTIPIFWIIRNNVLEFIDIKSSIGK